MASSMLVSERHVLIIAISSSLFIAAQVRCFAVFWTQSAFTDLSTSGISVLTLHVKL